MKNYPGNKGGQGIREFLVNYIPKSNRYFSLFYGGGGFENCKYMKTITWTCAEINPDNTKYETDTAVITFSDYRYLIAKINFTQDDFVFADPPYLFSTRLSGKKIYKYEFTKPQHIEVLNYISSLNSKILITHPKNALYDRLLPNFNCIEFEYMTHGGWFKDAIYFNYSTADIELVNYATLGENFTERQQIKRKRKSMINKIEKLPILQQKALIAELKKRKIV